jgi:hypothetical protein
VWSAIKNHKKTKFSCKIFNSFSDYQFSIFMQRTRDYSARGISLDGLHADPWEGKRSECARLADRAAKASKYHSEVIPAMQFVSLVYILHLQATRYCMPHHSSRLFTADKILLWKITLQTSQHCTRLVGFLNIHHIKTYNKSVKIKGYNIPKYSTIKFIR